MKEKSYLILPNSERFIQSTIRELKENSTLLHKKKRDKESNNRDKGYNESKWKILYFNFTCII